MPVTTVRPTLKWDVLVTNRQGLIRDLPPGKEQWTWVPTSATLIIGSVHGGYAATLLDSACGCAAHSRLTASQAFTTLELKVAYHKRITKDTGLLRAEGNLLSFGQRVAFAEAKLTDVQGTLYASATSTLLVFDR